MMMLGKGVIERASVVALAATLGACGHDFTGHYIGSFSTVAATTEAVGGGTVDVWISAGAIAGTAKDFDGDSYSVNGTIDGSGSAKLSFSSTMQAISAEGAVSMAGDHLVGTLQVYIGTAYRGTMSIDLTKLAR